MINDMHFIHNSRTYSLFFQFLSQGMISIRNVRVVRFSDTQQQFQNVYQ